MNNNRGGNNRRRGRGNNNPRVPGAGAGSQVNRIDSRARGNAPQMLEKYRKLANDAHLNGDRVNAEYYLQFADHYFRVIADTRVRQEEQRLRRDDRWPDGGDGGSDDGDDGGEFGGESEFPAFDQPPVYTRREREDRPERAPERTNEPASERQSYRPAAEAAPRQSISPDQPAPGSSSGSADGGDGVTAYEPPANPFLRENRAGQNQAGQSLGQNQGGRGLRPRREDRRPRRDERSDSAGEPPAPMPAIADTDRAARALSAGIDPDSLPPAFTVPRDGPDPDDSTDRDEAAVTAPEAPAPRRRARRKPAADDAGEPVQSLI